MTEEYLLSKLAENPWGWGLIVFAIMYFEFRVFDVWVDIMATNKAIASKVAVTPEELAAIPRPRSLASFFTRLVKRAPAALLILAVLLATLQGCSASESLRRNVDTLDSSWKMFKAASDPAPGVDPFAYGELEGAMDRNIEAQRAAVR